MTPPGERGFFIYGVTINPKEITPGTQDTLRGKE
jgi:hypothetical protein